MFCRRSKKIKELESIISNLESEKKQLEEDKKNIENKKNNYYNIINSDYNKIKLDNKKTLVFDKIIGKFKIFSHENDFDKIITARFNFILSIIWLIVYFFIAINLINNNNNNINITMNLIITASTLILITNIEFIYKSIVLICKQNTMINKNNFQKLYSNDLSTVKMFSITSYLAVIISFTIILSAIDNHKTNYYEEFYIKI